LYVSEGDDDNLVSMSLFLKLWSMSMKCTREEGKDTTNQIQCCVFLYHGELRRGNGYIPSSYSVGPYFARYETTSQPQVVISDSRLLRLGDLEMEIRRYVCSLNESVGVIELV